MRGTTRCKECYTTTMDRLQRYDETDEEIEEVEMEAPSSTPLGQDQNMAISTAMVAQTLEECLEAMRRHTVDRETPRTQTVPVTQIPPPRATMVE
ncbi:hypothetical protein L1987_24813 [Smallanthus sonchifolius]|uniref:Uncharacterized protein n=1 Tax=Smallanthus sonchifolius TaxID=185202 RepID=A0ACB9IN88_9ASTR|nr:hypothetical protein L1987_24813 [Smallanthus sonchifolius]